MYHLKTHAVDVAWPPLDFPAESLRVPHTDPDTGATSVLTRLAPGAVIPEHLHTTADETVYVLEGDFVADGQAHMIGSEVCLRCSPHGRGSVWQQDSRSCGHQLHKCLWINDLRRFLPSRVQ